MVDGSKIQLNCANYVKNAKKKAKRFKIYAFNFIDFFI